MGKIIELLIILGLLVFSFFSGVKYSENVKEHASWLFEDKEGDAAMPEGATEEVVPATDGVSTFTDETAADSDALVQPEVAPAAGTPSAPVAPAAPAVPAAPVAPAAPAAGK
jgi:hypothetical protein